MLIYTNFGHSASRLMEGVDVILPGDVLYIIDKINRERIVYLKGIGGNPYSLNCLDIGAQALFKLKGDFLQIMRDENGNKNYVVVPSIEEGDILFESREDRETYRNLLYLGLIQVEVFFETTSEVDLCRPTIRESLFYSSNQEACRRDKEVGDKRFDKKRSERLEQLRGQISREYIEMQYTEFDEHRSSQEQPTIIEAIHPEFDLNNAPYKPLEELITICL